MHVRSRQHGSPRSLMSPAPNSTRNSQPAEGEDHRQGGATRRCPGRSRGSRPRAAASPSRSRSTSRRCSRSTGRGPTAQPGRHRDGQWGALRQADDERGGHDHARASRTRAAAGPSSASGRSSARDGTAPARGSRGAGVRPCSPASAGNWRTRRRTRQVDEPRPRSMSRRAIEESGRPDRASASRSGRDRRRIVAHATSACRSPVTIRTWRRRGPSSGGS